MSEATEKENRWSKRRALRLDVDVVEQGVTLASSFTRDVGLGGVFVEWNGYPLEAESQVDLLFNLHPDDGKTCKHRLHAKVVRVTSEGIGLSFQDFDTVAFRSLQALMGEGGMSATA